MEFYPERFQPVDEGGQRVMEITKGRVSRVSLVDVPAYPSSRFAVRAEGEPEPEIRIDVPPLSEVTVAVHRSGSLWLS